MEVDFEEEEIVVDESWEEEEEEVVIITEEEGVLMEDGVEIVEEEEFTVNEEEEVVSDASEYADQVIESWAEVIEEEPEDLEAAVSALIALVYRDDPDVDVESMLRRTPLPDLYKYLKLQYWYKVHTNKEEAEQLKAASEGSVLETPSQIVNVDDMLKGRLQDLIENVQQKRIYSGSVNSVESVDSDMSERKQRESQMQNLILNVQSTARFCRKLKKLAQESEDNNTQQRLSDKENNDEDSWNDKVATSGGGHHVAKYYEQAVNNRAQRVAGTKLKRPADDLHVDLQDDDFNPPKKVPLSPPPPPPTPDPVDGLGDSSEEGEGEEQKIEQPKERTPPPSPNYKPVLFSDLLNYRKLDNAISIQDSFTQADGTLVPRITTRGWDFLVRWIEGDDSWVPLRHLIRTHPVQVAEFAVGNNLEKEPAFAWWVHHVLNNEIDIIEKFIVDDDEDIALVNNEADVVVVDHEMALAGEAGVAAEEEGKAAATEMITEEVIVYEDEIMEEEIIIIEEEIIVDQMTEYELVVDLSKDGLDDDEGLTDEDVEELEKNLVDFSERKETFRPIKVDDEGERAEGEDGTEMLSSGNDDSKNNEKDSDQSSDDEDGEVEMWENECGDEDTEDDSSKTDDDGGVEVWENEGGDEDSEDESWKTGDEGEVEMWENEGGDEDEGEDEEEDESSEEEGDDSIDSESDDEEDEEGEEGEGDSSSDSGSSLGSTILRMEAEAIASGRVSPFKIVLPGGHKRSSSMNNLMLLQLDSSNKSNSSIRRGLLNDPKQHNSFVNFMNRMKNTPAPAYFQAPSSTSTKPINAPPAGEGQQGVAIFGGAKSGAPRRCWSDNALGEKRKTEESSTTDSDSPNTKFSELVQAISSDYEGNKEWIPDSFWQNYFDPITEARTKHYILEVVRAMRGQDLDTLRRIFYEKGGKVTMEACNPQGESLLHLACRRRNAELVHFLVVEAGVNVKVRDDWGKTPLHELCWNSEKRTPSQFKSVQLLIHHAPELLVARDRRGFLPLQYVPRDAWRDWSRFLERNKEDLEWKMELIDFDRAKDRLRDVLKLSEPKERLIPL